jgi:hypothetical protein
MATPPAVTVIMPVHNRERFVVAALDSLLAQTFTDFAVLVVDDHSTDGTARLLDGYAEDGRIRVIRNSTQLGVARARNRAIDAADTPFVAFHDSDDLADPRRLELQLAFIRNHDLDLVGSGVELVAEDGSATGDRWSYDGSSAALSSAMLFRNRLATSTMVVKRSVLGDERFDPELEPVDDYDMWVRLLGTRRGGCLPQPLVRYRVHSSSLMHTRHHRADAGVRRILRRQLDRLGLTPTDAELQLHRDLGTGSVAGTARVLSAAANWLRKLDEANTERRIYPTDVFRDELALQWFVACEAAARRGAWAAWPAIVGSRHTVRLTAMPVARRRLLTLPWRTARGFVRRRWPGAGSALRARVG